MSFEQHGLAIAESLANFFAVLDGVDADLLKGGGKNTEGMYLSSPDFSAFTGDYAGFLEKHKAKYGGSTLSTFHAHAYDATNILFAALDKVAVVDATGKYLQGGVVYLHQPDRAKEELLRTIA